MFFDVTKDFTQQKNLRLLIDMVKALTAHADIAPRFIADNPNVFYNEFDDQYCIKANTHRYDDILFKIAKSLENLSEISYSLISSKDGMLLAIDGKQFDAATGKDTIKTQEQQKEVKK